MAEPAAAAFRVHEDRARFSAALTSTAAETGFSARLVEKDYFCTLLLSELAPVLRQSDLAAFDLDRAWATVNRVATAIREWR